MKASKRATPLFREAVWLLRQLIATPSYSREEEITARLIKDFLEKQGVRAQRLGNNVWARSKYWQADKPILLLNSHHDTVRPGKGWKRVPFEPVEENGRLYGLGSNDAGGCLVSLLAAFLYFFDRRDLPVNLLVAATAEEEVSGANGIAALIPEWPPIWAGIVGEPTLLQMAIAEKGLMVIDGEARGVAGHAAREEGVNAIYLAMQDIEWLRQYAFDRVSELLGPVKVSVTQIEAGHQHNVVPDSCRFVIDVRTNELYSNEEVFEILRKHTRSELKARSFRLNSSRIGLDHPLVESGKKLGLPHFGSPTLSDQALLRLPTLKIGPGDSARSHTADEYIQLSEIEAGIHTYIQLIGQIDPRQPNAERI